MPDFTFRCPCCRQKIETQEKWRGRTSKCPHCGSTIQIPPPPSPPSPPSPPLPPKNANETPTVRTPPPPFPPKDEPVIPIVKPPPLPPKDEPVIPIVKPPPLPSRKVVSPKPRNPPDALFSEPPDVRFQREDGDRHAKMFPETTITGGLREKVGFYSCCLLLFLGVLVFVTSILCVQFSEEEKNFQNVSILNYMRYYYPLAGLGYLLSCVFAFVVNRKVFRITDVALKNSRTPISSKDIMDILALICGFGVIGSAGAAFLFFFLFKCPVPIFLACLLPCVVCVFHFLAARTPEIIGLYYDKSSSPGKDFISLIMFTLKTSMAFLPYYFASGTICLFVLLFCSWSGIEKSRTLISTLYIPLSAVCFGPLCIYILFLFVNFVMEIAFSILRIPDKPDSCGKSKI